MRPPHTTRRLGFQALNPRLVLASDLPLDAYPFHELYAQDESVDGFESSELGSSELGSSELGSSGMSATLHPEALAAARWETTASGEVSPVPGETLQLTVSIIPDGTWIPGRKGRAGEPSSLIASLDARFGGGDGPLSERPWFPLVQAALDAWSSVSGLTFVFEPNDDGAAHVLADGVIGQRGDIRLGARTMDGQLGVLGATYSPDSGDVVLDRDDILAAADASTVINVLTHELGHAIGLRHAFLLGDHRTIMSPVLDRDVNGLQHFDQLYVTAVYGDAMEPNQAPEQATSLHTPDGLAIAENVAISSPLDIDTYQFYLAGDTTVELTLSPVGESLEQIDHGQLYRFDSRLHADLQFQLLDADRQWIATASDQPAGEVESLTMQLPAGEYYVQVSGDPDAMPQLYDLQLQIQAPAAEVLHVTSLADPVDPPPSSDDGMSLREALAIAQARPGTTTIQLPAGQIDLSSTLIIDKPLRIIGTGATPTVLSGSGQFRIFDVTADLSLSHLVVERGDATNELPPPSIPFQPTYWGAGGGGGLRVTNANLELDQVHFRDNQSDMPGGAVLAMDAAVRVTDSLFENNTGRYGGGIQLNGGDAQIINTAFRGNSANQGGAIGNQAQLYIQGSSFDGNQAGSLGSGGGTAIFNFSGNNSSVLLIEDSEFVRNSGRSAVIDSSARSLVSIFSSTIAENTTIEGTGGVFLSGPAVIANTTISQNQGGGLFLKPYGDVVIDHVTIVDNTGPGIEVWTFAETTGNVSITNSIVAGNYRDNGDIFGLVESLGGNVIGVADWAGGLSTPSSDLWGTSDSPLDARLGPLAHHGGPTRTHALLPDSPAIDRGVGVPGTGIDQRGAARGQDGTGNGVLRSDSGAVEMSAPREGARRPAGEQVEVETTVGDGLNHHWESAANDLVRTLTPGQSTAFELEVAEAGLFSISVQATPSGFSTQPALEVLIDGHSLGKLPFESLVATGEFTTMSWQPSVPLPTGVHQVVLTVPESSGAVAVDWATAARVADLPEVVLGGGVLIEGFEGPPPAPLTMTLTEPAGVPIDFLVSAVPGTADVNDYALPQVVHFPAGVVEQTVELYALTDGEVEGIEQFTVVVHDTMGGLVGEHPIKIIDDQPASTRPIVVLVDAKTPQPQFISLHIYGIGLGDVHQVDYPGLPLRIEAAPEPEPVEPSNYRVRETRGGAEIEIPQADFDQQRTLRVESSNGTTLVAPGPFRTDVTGVRRGSDGEFVVVPTGVVFRAGEGDRVILVEDGGQVVLDDPIKRSVFVQSGGRVETTTGVAQVHVEPGAEVVGADNLSTLVSVELSVVAPYELASGAEPDQGQPVDGSAEDPLGEEPATLEAFDPRDVNHDGATTLLDALAVIHALRDVERTYVERMDVNGDGRISLVDATAIFAELHRRAAAGEPTAGATNMDEGVIDKPTSAAVYAADVDQIFADEEEEGDRFHQPWWDLSSQISRASDLDNDSLDPGRG